MSDIIKEGFDDLKKSMSDWKAGMDKELAQEKAARDAELAKQQEFNEQVKKDMIKKDATLGDIVEFQKAQNAKEGRFTGDGAQRGQNKSALEAAISKSIWDNKDAHIRAATSGEHIGIQGKAITTGSLSGTGSPYPTYLPWQPGMEPIGQYRVRNLVQTIPSDFDTVYFPRAVTPVGLAGSFGRQTTEGNAKATVARTWTMQTVNLTAFAASIDVSRQSLNNIPYLQTWLPTSLMEQLMDQEDLDFANQLVAGATGSSSTTGAGSVAIEQVIFLLKNLIATKFNPTGVALDPAKWAGMLITKPSNYSLPNAVVIDQAGTVRILGRPIYPVNWLTGGRTLIGDFTKAAIVEREGYTLRTTDSHSTNFVANLLTYLLERVQNIAIYRPDAFITAILP